MIGDRLKVVFDCNLFAQALISPRGPAGACFTLAQIGAIQLFFSDYLLFEIPALPRKIKVKYGVDDAKIESLVLELKRRATHVAIVPPVYIHPLDADDSHYVDLAVATGATIISSRDQHLLALADRLGPLGQEFAQRFPNIEVLTPDDLLRRVRNETSRP